MGSDWGHGTQWLRVAIADHDEADHVLDDLLRRVGHRPHRFWRGEPLLHALQQHSFDAFVLDWELPDIAGIELLRAVRAKCGWSAPVLFIGDDSRAEGIARALWAGADDYLTKPIRGAEFLARLEAKVRRVIGRADDLTAHLEDYHIDFEERLVFHHGHALELTPKEFDLAVLMLGSAGRLVSHGEILECVWGRAASVRTRAIQTWISRVRVKLGWMPPNGWRLACVYRCGYRLQKLDQPAGSATHGLSG